MNLNLTPDDDRDLPGDDESIREQELSHYEARYGEDAMPEEEQRVLLGELMRESRDVIQMVSTAEAIYQHAPAIEQMDDVDAQLSLEMLADRASQYPIPGISFERADNSDRNEGLLQTLLQWAGQAITAAYKILGYTIKRTGVFISRTKKNAEGLDKRLTRLDGLMKKRKTEDNRIFFSKNKLVLLADGYDVNTSPAGAVSSFAGEIFSIVDKYVDLIRTIMIKVDSDLNQSEGSEIDIKNYQKMVDDLLSDLDGKYKNRDELIGNRYIKIDKNAKLSKAVSLAIGRPDPKSIVGKYRPMNALSNSAVESQRDSLRSGAIKKMFVVIDNTAEDMDKASKFTKLSSKKGKEKSDASPDKKDIATLSKFLTDTTKELIEGIMSMSDMVYETVDAAVSLLEDSVTVTQIHGTTDGREAARFLT